MQAFICLAQERAENECIVKLPAGCEIWLSYVPEMHSILAIHLRDTAHEIITTSLRKNLRSGEYILANGRRLMLAIGGVLPVLKDKIDDFEKNYRG